MILDLVTAAKYNQWANDRVYRALSAMSDDSRKLNRRGFFSSIHNTLNHILLVDLLYRGRLDGKGNIFNGLNLILHDDFNALADAQRESDEWYITFYSQFDNGRLDDKFVFAPVGMDEGQIYGQTYRVCFTNLFQYQIHHRGQTHHMISHAEVAPPPLDFIMFSREANDEWSAPVQG